MATREAKPRSLGRLSEIAQVAVRHGFGYFLRRNRLGDLASGTDGAPSAISERRPRLRGLASRVAIA